MKEKKTLRSAAADPSAEGQSAGGASTDSVTHVITSPNSTMQVTMTGTHPKLAAFAKIVAAFLPIVEAGVAPFEKSAGAISIAQSEEPLVNGLFTALSEL